MKELFSSRDMGQNQATLRTVSCKGKSFVAATPLKERNSPWNGSLFQVLRTLEIKMLRDLIPLMSKESLMLPKEDSCCGSGPQTLLFLFCFVLFLLHFILSVFLFLFLPSSLSSAMTSPFHHNHLFSPICLCPNKYLYSCWDLQCMS